MFRSHPVECAAVGRTRSPTLFKSFGIQDSNFLSNFYVKLFVTTRGRGASGGIVKNHTKSLNYGLVRIGPDVIGKAVTTR